MRFLQLTPLQPQWAALPISSFYSSNDAFPGLGRCVSLDARSKKSAPFGNG